MLPLATIHHNFESVLHLCTIRGASFLLKIHPLGIIVSLVQIESNRRRRWPKCDCCWKLHHASRLRMAPKTGTSPIATRTPSSTVNLWQHTGTEARNNDACVILSPSSPARLVLRETLQQPPINPLVPASSPRLHPLPNKPHLSRNPSFAHNFLPHLPSVLLKLARLAQRTIHHPKQPESMVRGCLGSHLLNVQLDHSHVAHRILHDCEIF